MAYFFILLYVSSVSIFAPVVYLPFGSAEKKKKKKKKSFAKNKKEIWFLM